MKTLFARPVQLWPLCSHITVPYIVTFSAECDVTAAIPTEQEQLDFLDRGIRGATGPVWRILRTENLTPAVSQSTIPLQPTHQLLQILNYTQYHT